jgi:hypothetical protein
VDTTEPSAAAPIAPCRTPEAAIIEIVIGAATVRVAPGIDAVSNRRTGSGLDLCKSSVSDTFLTARLSGQTFAHHFRALKVGSRRRLRSNLILVNRSRSAGASFVKQTIAAILQKSAPPLANCVFVEAELSRHILARQAVRTSQNDATSAHTVTGQCGDDELASPNTPAPAHSAPTQQSTAAFAMALSLSKLRALFYNVTNLCSG